MDVIASYRSDLGEAVCSLGTALSDSQARLIKKYADEIIICYDGDKAGISNTLKAINVFKRNNFKVYTVMLPDKLDPDEYVSKYGTLAYKNYFESHITDSLEYEFNAQFIDKNLEDREVLNEVKNNVFEIINKLNSQIEIDKYLNKFKNRINCELDSLLIDFNDYKNNHVISNMNNTNIEYVPNYYDYQEFVDINPKVEIVKPKALYKNISEIRLFRYAFQNRQLAKTIDEKIFNDLGGMLEENQNLWMTLINDYYENFDTFDQGKFVKLLDGKDLEHYLDINDLIFKEIITDDLKDLEICIEKIKSLNYDESNKRLNKKVLNEKDDIIKVQLVEKMFKNRKLKENKEKEIKSKKNNNML